LRPVGSRANRALRPSATPDEDQAVEPDEGCVPGQLVNGAVAAGEHRDPVAAIDPVIPQRVIAQDGRIEAATANQHIVVRQDVAAS
jgi:hypothetical protein